MHKILLKIALPPLQRYRYACLAWGSLLLLWGCVGGARLYEENQDLPKAEWRDDKELVFSFEVKDAARRYDLFYNIRNTADYPFYNLYIKYRLEGANGTLLDEQLQNVLLFNATTGEPFGSGFGGTFSHQLSNPQLTKYRFPKAGKYTLRLRQYMRRQSLPGLLSIGLRVE